MRALLSYWKFKYLIFFIPWIQGCVVDDPCAQGLDEWDQVCGHQVEGYLQAASPATQLYLDLHCSWNENPSTFPVCQTLQWEITFKDGSLISLSGRTQLDAYGIRELPSAHGNALWIYLSPKENIPSIQGTVNLSIEIPNALVREGNIPLHAPETQLCTSECAHLDLWVYTDENHSYSLGVPEELSEINLITDPNNGDFHILIDHISLLVPQKSQREYLCQDGHLYYYAYTP